MTTLVLQAHPLEDSYNAAVLDVVIESLADADEPFDVVRMCQSASPSTAQLVAADTLIIVAPTWWGSMPAVVWDWIQSDLVDWIDGQGDHKTSPLRGITDLIVVPTHGSSRLVNTLQGEPGRNLWRRTVLRLCDGSAEFHWVSLYKLDRRSTSELEMFLKRVRVEVTSVLSASRSETQTSDPGRRPDRDRTT